MGIGITRSTTSKEALRESTDKEYPAWNDHRSPIATLSTKTLRSEEDYLASGLYPPLKVWTVLSVPLPRLPTKKLLRSSRYDTSFRSYHLDFHYQVVPVEKHKLRQRKKVRLIKMPRPRPPPTPPPRPPRPGPYPHPPPDVPTPPHTPRYY